MNQTLKTVLLFLLVGVLILLTGVYQSWNSALLIVNMGLISAIMALGVNLQWGFAGLFNVGVMGFVALGGLGAVLVSMPPSPGAWGLGGGWRIVLGLLMGALTVVAATMVQTRMAKGTARTLTTLVLLVGGFFLYRWVFDGGVDFVESITPAVTGNIGGLNPGGVENYKGYGWITLIAWPFGGLLAAGAAWVIGKTALGLRSDYLAIATLGISEIVIAMLKNEDWLTRGVKNVSGLDRPVPYEIDLQEAGWFRNLIESLNSSSLQVLEPAARSDALQQFVIDGSSIFVKLCYVLLFAAVLLAVLWFSERALKSPWGRMMRAIRDNEVAASAMGKNVTRRHLQVFVLGSAVVGVAGAMLTTLDGQFTPGTYNPLRFTFLIWVMVIVGGSGNNYGAVLGGFLIWFLWIEAEPVGLWLMSTLTSGLAEDNALRQHLIEGAAHMRLFTMGLILLLVMRFSPRGLLPEVVRR